MSTVSPASKKWHWMQLGLWLVLISFAGVHYLKGVEKQWMLNPLIRGEKKGTYDQPFYIKEARQFATGTDLSIARSRMPVYPWLLAFLHDDHLTKEQQLDRYLTFNVTVSILVLVGVAIFASQWIGCFWSCWLALLAAFHVFLYKAALVQPELLFFGLYFGVFVGMMSVLHRPTWPRAALLGFFTGLTFLVKGSVLPPFVLFIALLTLRTLWDWYQRGRSLPAFSAGLAGPQWKQFLPLVAFVAGVLNVVGVFTINTYRWYGSPVYDPASRYYMWADTQAEMLTMQDLGLSAHPAYLDIYHVDKPEMQQFLSKWVPDEAKRARLVALVREKEEVRLQGEWDVMPGPKNYWRDHTPAQAWERLKWGMNDLVKRNYKHPDGYGPYMTVAMIAALLITIAAAFRLDKNAWRRLLAEHGWSIAFAAVCLAGNYLLYAWWGTISNRNRFFLTQFLPTMFCLIVVIRWGLAQFPWSVTLPSKLSGTGEPIRVNAGTVVAVSAMGWLVAYNIHLQTAHLYQ